ncbi:MAG: deoxyribonuclease IV [Desulfobacteraceae bacterium]|nr:deoxyribonuclease IV [Desulfobacteraceae bacterium]
MNKKPLLGAHFSTAGGLENAIYSAHKYRCSTLQIFTRNARSWKTKKLSLDEIEKFNRAKKETGISRIISHASYLINIASNDKDKYGKSINALKNELIRSSKLGIESVVLHPGSHLNQGEKNGIEIVVGTINSIYSGADNISARLILETTAGQGTNLGYQFEQLAEMIDKTNIAAKVGVCLDTCHIFAAGYDISTSNACVKTFKKFDSIIGLKHLSVLHLNDSLHELGSKKDRHAHIGKGYIGDDAFNFIMQDSRFDNIPKILETPKNDEKDNTKDMDRVNLEKLQNAGKALAS